MPELCFQAAPLRARPSTISKSSSPQGATNKSSSRTSSKKRQRAPAKLQETFLKLISGTVRGGDVPENLGSAADPRFTGNTFAVDATAEPLAGSADPPEVVRPVLGHMPPGSKPLRFRHLAAFVRFAGSAGVARVRKLSWSLRRHVRPPVVPRRAPRRIGRHVVAPPYQGENDLAASMA